MTSDILPDRDLRLEFFCGLATWILFLEYFRSNAVGWVTIRNYGFSDSTELCVFLFGYMMALTYGRMVVYNPVLAIGRLIKQAWQLYVAHIFLLLIFLAGMFYDAATYDNPLYAEELRIFYVFVGPDSIVQALLLKFEPLPFDILRLLIVLSLATSPILWLMNYKPNILLAASALLCIAASYFTWNLPSYPPGGWFLNPFAWQLAFVFGAWCTRFDVSQMIQWARPWSVVAPTILVAFGFLVSMTGRPHIPVYLPLMLVFVALSVGVIRHLNLASILRRVILTLRARKRLVGAILFLVLVLVIIFAIFFRHFKHLAPSALGLVNWMHPIGDAYLDILNSSSQLLYPNDKTDLDFMRLVHFLALAALAVYVVPPNWKGLNAPIFRPAILCGQFYLLTFVVGIFLAKIAQVILFEYRSGPLMEGILGSLGIAIMATIAWLVSWFNQLTPTRILLQRITAVAQQLAREPDLARLDDIAKELPEDDFGFSSGVGPLRGLIANISRQQRRLDTIQRPFFREPLADAIRTEVENFYRLTNRLSPPLDLAFSRAAAQWLKIADDQWRQMQVIVVKTPTPQVFRAGDPVDRDQEAFVPRLGFISDLEGQLMLATGCPGLVLYGRRRTGKSTTLKNLSGFLPPQVQVTTISMQNPDAFTSIASLIRLLADTVSHACEIDIRSSIADLQTLYAGLTRANAHLNAQKRRLLLAIDEYEHIDDKIGSGVFSQDLLSMLRESIQEHRNITWVFVGSHDVSELVHAPWTSYLVSARTMEMPLFSQKETSLLLTEPIRYSALRDSGNIKTFRFSAEMWGVNGIENIHAEAAGWPHLVQLIAETIIDLLNDSAVLKADAAMLNLALDRAIVRGDLVLRQLVQQECTIPGEWEYISGFRRNDFQLPPTDGKIYQSLKRRLIVLEKAGKWRLRVPLMQRWLRARG